MAIYWDLQRDIRVCRNTGKSNRKARGHEMKSIRLFRVWSVGFGAQSLGFGRAWRVGLLDLCMWG